MLAQKLAAGLSPRRVHHLRAVLRRALGQAVRWGLLSRNAAALAAPPRVAYQPPPAMDPATARRILEAVAGDRLGPLYTVALATGLRQGELLGLRWEDVDLERASLRVTGALQRVDGEYRIVEPKTARARRTLPLARPAVEALRLQRQRQREERLRAGPLWEDWGLVFTTERGRPLNHSVVTKRLQDLLAAAGLPRLRFHDLRHGCATLLLSAGVPPRAIMELLGHSQITLTLGTYAHVIPAMLEDAAARMDAVLGSG